jgi:hypothetical protein
MFKYIVLLVIGISIGYFIGFGDAKKHTDNVVQRLVTRVGLGAGAQSNDIDARMEKVGRGGE